ncbi:Auxin-responsive protein IAA25 [Acorus gramineus]|uniref:Auxin-responsive protein n=1 Tax=Acorus gramineus TaxID=55184 RepID=A0AAV9BH78_ACOGR|nr:Auxin-responsive protein IAA25 [Acorus gramineus]
MKSLLSETAQKQGGGGGGGEMKTTTNFQNHLELRLGFSPSGLEDSGGGGGERLHPAKAGLMSGTSGGGAGAKRWFLEETAGSGFVHPWSLAARQETAVLEQAHDALSRSTPVVGWPPVRAFRRQRVSFQLSTKSKEMEEPKKEEKAAPTTEETEQDGDMRKDDGSSNRSSMYVKVNMEGYGIGRKINLGAHDNYESLSHALFKMFQNFLSVDCLASDDNDDEIDYAADYIIIYEDNEKDRMLLGDVPWEMFIASVRRLYLMKNTSAPFPASAPRDSK